MTTSEYLFDIINKIDNLIYKDVAYNNIDNRFSIEMRPVAEILNFFKKQYKQDPWEYISGDEHNGWQVDFWYILYRTDDFELILSGSLFYGKFVIGRYEREIPDEEDEE